eukprot:10210655-Alexandrium_andersonii.AAC.1
MAPKTYRRPAAAAALPPVIVDRPTGKSKAEARVAAKAKAKAAVKKRSLPAWGGMSARALRQHCLIDISEPTASKTVKLLSSKLSNDQLVTLAKHIKSIRTVSMGSACSGSGIAAVATKFLFEILGVGSVRDAYA